MDIHWYPGHMTKSKRQIMADIGLCDIVLELLDARIPQSSRNPDIEEIAAGKKHIIVLNKADLADERVTSKWESHYRELGYLCIPAVSNSSKNKTAVVKAAEELMREKRARLKNKGRDNVVARAIVLGIPNVGKSTLINQYAKRQAAAVANKPGVTRGRQWVRVNPTFELLDTPGILWPKLDDADVAARLALTGAVKEARVDMTELALYCLRVLQELAPSAVKTRYKTDYEQNEHVLDILAKIGVARGFVMQGGAVDMERTAGTLVREFRDGRLGRISLELPVLQAQKV